MKKFLLYILFVLLGVGVIDILFSFGIEKMLRTWNTLTISTTHYASPDIAIFGASRAHHHYNPHIIGDSLNCSVYVYAKDGMNIYYHYTMLCALLEHAEQKPGVVIFEMSEIDVDDTPGHNTEILHFLYPYYYNELAAKHVVSDLLDREELFLVRISGLYRSNSKLLSYAKSAFRKKLDPNYGYAPLYNVWAEPIEEHEEYKEHVDRKKMEYVNKVIEICKNNNIKLVLVNSPNFAIIHANKWENEIRDLAQRSEIEFLNYGQDSTFMQHNEWFQDWDHLNTVGADIYSRIITEDIKRCVEKVTCD